MGHENDVNQHTVEVGASSSGAWAAMIFLSILVICATVITVVLLVR